LEKGIIRVLRERETERERERVRRNVRKSREERPKAYVLKLSCCRE